MNRLWMRNGKKASILAVLLAVGLVGCSGNAPKADPVAETTDGSLGKQLEISWIGANARGKVEDGNYVQQKLEEKFNVKLKNKKIDVVNKEQVNLMVASGELADATYFVGYDVRKLYEEGQIRSIPKEMIVKYAPNYAKLLDSDATGWKQAVATDKKEEYISLLGVAKTVEGLIWGNIYRLDWLEKAGIQPKGNPKAIGTTENRDRVFFTDQAFTLDEEEKIFDAFVNKDPDGNGKKDTYGFTPNNNAMQWWASGYLGAFGVGFNYNLQEDGKVVEYNISSGYKAFVKKMADWYKKGFVDPEFVTLNNNKAWEKFATGKIGSSQVQYSMAGLVGGGLTRPPGNLLAQDPNAKILFTPPQIGSDGKQGAAAYKPVSLLGDGYDFVIRKDVTDEELIRILQIFDYVNFDKEGVVLGLYGEAGKHFDWEDEPYNSAIMAKKEFATGDDKNGFRYYSHTMNTEQFLVYITPKDVMKLLNDYFFNKDKGMKLLIRPYKYDFFNETNYKTLYSTLGQKLQTIVDEFTFKAITGEIDVEASWDNYVKQWRTNGGDQLLAELEKSPKVADLLNAQ